MVLFVVALATSLTFFGCTTETEPEEPSQEPLPYDVPLRSDAELANAIDALCRDAVERGRPGLVEFSASWCGDCRKLHGMKQTPVLAAELESWPRMTINVGRFDRHRPLLSSLGVESIAHWAVLEPNDCRDDIASWRRLGERTLEVSSGAARDVSPEELAGWLEDLRSS